MECENAESNAAEEKVFIKAVIIEGIPIPKESTPQERKDGLSRLVSGFLSTLRSKRQKEKNFVESIITTITKLHERLSY